jgi:hypothetical protein
MLFYCVNFTHLLNEALSKAVREAATQQLLLGMQAGEQKQPAAE